MLETDRLYLVLPSNENIVDIFKVHADPSTNKYNPNGPESNIDDFKMTYEQWLNHHKKHHFGYYILIDKSDNVPFGVCGLKYTKLKGETVLNIYYRISTDKTRQGFVKEAALKVINHVLNLTNNQYRIIAKTKKDNIPSIKTAENLGFKLDKSYNDYGEEDNVYLFIS